MALLLPLLLPACNSSPSSSSSPSPLSSAPLPRLSSLPPRHWQDDLSAALGIQTTGKPAPHPRLMHRHRQLARAAMPGATEEEVEAAAAAASTRVVVDEAAGLLMPTTGDSGHCSAVIRPLTGTDGTYDDILISQVTWSGFEDMVSGGHVRSKTW